LLIFPAEMHDVHTRTRRRVPDASMIRAVCRLGSHRRLVLLFAWLTLFPTDRPLPQIEHVRAMITPFESFR
jgi:hypothetical protein